MGDGKKNAGGPEAAGTLPALKPVTNYYLPMATLTSRFKLML
jgi:hypothetical protein